MVKSVDEYLVTGCMRCRFGATPQCKVHTWKEELEALRSIMRSCKLNEEIKWGMPCYTSDGKNILMISALRDYCAAGFFKGSLLKDEKRLLTSPGENSQSVRQFRFTSLSQVQSMAPALRRFVKEALALEKSGAKVVKKGADEYPVPEEFRNKMKALPALKKAFYALTPGRQRSYLLHFSGAKQSTTRIDRIEKCIPLIMNGIGFNELGKRRKR